MVKILGFDPGYGRLGFGIIESGKGKAVAVAFGVITTDSKIEHAERLREIAVDVRALIKKHRPDFISIEELFFGQNTTTALKVAEVRGVLLLLSAEAHLPVFQVKPVEVKMALTGYGKADKRQMQNMVKTVFHLLSIPKPDDAADALAIAWAAIGRR
ncbi:MAG: crossover junction endodeoxyribonuclease RuvC [Patescibacteria group bacterium]|jgi:crossover junction endodeoxyribonuclease RuvC